jgi:hydroxypyruvate isomerase
MRPISRRNLLSRASALSGDAQQPARATGKNIKQSVCRGPYRQIPLDGFCRAAADMGIRGIDLLGPEEWGIPPKYGLVCAMGYAAPQSVMSIDNGLNRKEHHDAIEKAFRENIASAASNRVANLIVLSGNRHHLPDDVGAENTIIGLNRLKPLAEDHGINICLELLNSKITHPDYMADHTAWGVSVVRAVNSPRIKLLYDIFHMQIQEGDVIRTIQENSQWIGHFHTGGVPGRHELDDTQEVRWDGVMRGIAATGFTGYVAHEFSPTRDPLTSLREAVMLCDV